MEIFKITLPGTDVSQNDLKNEVVNSLYPSPKINTQANPPHAGLIFLNWTRTAGVAERVVIPIYSFPHGYNYIPTVIASYTFDNGVFIDNGVMPFQVGGEGMVVIDADAININLKYFSFDGAIPSTDIVPFIMHIRFYVFAERGYE